jgi:hypothetical protein
MHKDLDCRMADVNSKQFIFTLLDGSVVSILTSRRYVFLIRFANRAVVSWVKGQKKSTLRFDYYTKRNMVLVTNF